MRVEVDASFSLLAQRIVAACKAGGNGRGGTPLGASLAAVRDPAELNRKCAPWATGQGRYAAGIAGRGPCSTRGYGLAS